MTHRIAVDFFEFTFLDQDGNPDDEIGQYSDRALMEQEAGR